MSNGKWVLYEETLDIDLGITKRSLGVYGQRYLSHRNPQVGIPLADSLFQGIGDRVVLAGAEEGYVLLEPNAPCKSDKSRGRHLQ